MNKTLKEKAKLLEPALRIGKMGITENQVSAIRKLLEKKNLVKIKFLKSFINGKDKKRMALELAEKTESVLIDQVGHVAVLYKPKQ